jgi:hypothetical protein
VHALAVLTSARTHDAACCTGLCRGLLVLTVCDGGQLFHELKKTKRTLKSNLT